MAFAPKLSILDLSFGIDLVHALHVSASIDDGIFFSTYEILAVRFTCSLSMSRNVLNSISAVANDYMNQRDCKVSRAPLNMLVTG